MVRFPDASQGLRQLILELPMPGAPPRLSRRGAVLGLALLEASLSLNHIRRLTERLDLVEPRNVRRRTEIDLSLSMLGQAQRTALSSFGVAVDGRAGRAP